MCGIAGIIDLTGRRQPDPVVLQSMARSLWHRGPDDDGFLIRPGFGFASRRLSIVGLGDGRQPIFNEDGSVAVVYNGELFDYPERKAELQAKGHVFRTHTDTELIVHLYEEYGEGVFTELKGQFALALIDFSKRTIFLARDRVGICPLHWSQQGDWVYFGSEIKALLASGGVPAACDPRGLDHIFTFFAMGGRRTVFEGVQSILPGHYLKIAFRRDGKRTEVSEHRYWDFDFPDVGDEDDPADEAKLIDEFEATFRRAVEIRLRADVPVVGYLSGGVDFGLRARHRLAAAEPRNPELHHPGAGQELRRDAAGAADRPPRRQPPDDSNQRCQGHFRHLCQAHRVGRLPGSGYLLRGALVPVARGARSGLQSCAHGRRIGRGLRRLRLVQAARHELLAKQTLSRPERSVRSLHRRFLPPFTGLQGAEAYRRHRRRCARAELPSIISSRMPATATSAATSKTRIGDHSPYEDVPVDLERMRRWSPLNQSLYYGYKIHLAGQLLNYKGDRVAMANSVETRYPYLDEDVIAFPRDSPRAGSCVACATSTSCAARRRACCHGRWRCAARPCSALRSLRRSSPMRRRSCAS